MKLLMLSLASVGMLAAANIAAAPSDRPAPSNVELSGPGAISDATPDAGAAALGAGAEHADDANGIVDTVRHNRYELQRANMSSPRSTPDAELAGKARQMRSMDLAAKPAAEPPPAKVATTAPAQPPPALTPKASPLDIDSQTLEKLRQFPNGPAKALAIADSLFAGRRYDTAFAFYEMAMKSSPSDDTSAWILFQMGNCRRASDPAAAHEYYKRVLTDAPDSSWSKAAAAQDKLVQWEQANSPRTLLETTANAAQASATMPAASVARPSQAAAPASAGSAQPGKAALPKAAPGAGAAGAH